ncbi:type VI secretion system Vgr family protein [Caldimonas brevitalea]|uniref:Type VI secretion system secreted protein VgrG n=1 Tax=Caldimonas brevitalea TaxID=413882 RepID=A0A0G3BLQ5_9BURK|nr:type VI secretion system Vgr family protein [Caldimonas brevitalea]AKJ30327.1 type VI secretion system secreted protein VgrG [Caldimonas brevitalea]
MTDLSFLPAAIQALLAGYTQNDRLLHLHTLLGPNVLLAERMALTESIGPSGPDCGFKLELTALSADTHLELKQLIGQPVLLELLTQASRTALRPFHGQVTGFSLLGADGGLARYRLTVEPWLAFLAHRHDSRTFQSRTVMEIVEAVFAGYQGQGALAPAWRWDLADRAAYPQRSLCTQYQESDLAFIERLLREEGLFYWWEHTGDAGSKTLGQHVLVIADHNGACKPNRQPRVRYTQPGATMKEDSLRSWHGERRVTTQAVSMASWDYRSTQLRPVSAAALHPAGGIATECQDVPGVYAYEDSHQGQRLAQRQQEALDARGRLYYGEGTVRTFAPGSVITVLDHPHHTGEDKDRFVLLRAEHRARSNVSADHRAMLQDLLPGLLGTEKEDSGATKAGSLANDGDEPLYSVKVVALPATVVVRAPALDAALSPHAGLDSVVQHPRPTVTGTQTAIVVGLGAPIHTDRDHRIKVQFHWQRGAQGSHRLQVQGVDNAPASDASGTWVRVATSVAGANWGSVFTPRVGQEVLVAFLDGDIDRPVVIGSLYNGVGQDNAQGNQVNGGAAGATGNAPAWFPGSQAAGQHQGHQHAAVMTGLKTQELSASQSGAGGYNQLVFDDTPGQGRIQLASTQHRSQLNLGHALNQNDNQRLHPRGHGSELVTEASGALRAGSGLLISAEARAAGSTGGTAQLDTREAEQQLQQSAELTSTLIDTAQKHNAKLKDEPQAKDLPVPQAQKALRESIETTDQRGDAGSGDQAIGGGAGAVKAWSRPDLLVSAPAGVGLYSPANTIFSAGNTASWVAGQDITHNAQRHHSIAVQGGISWFTYGKASDPSKPNQETGIMLHAASGSVSSQSQSGATKLTADKAVEVSSTQAAIQMGAPKHILLTAGGSSIRIEGGDITLTTPGAAQFKASMKELTGPANASSSADLPAPQSVPPCGQQQAESVSNGAALL